jgi:hypothetical protein
MPLFSFLEGGCFFLFFEMPLPFANVLEIFSKMVKNDTSYIFPPIKFVLNQNLKFFSFFVFSGRDLSFSVLKINF